MYPHQLLLKEEGLDANELHSKAKRAISEFNAVVKICQTHKRKAEEAGKEYKMTDETKDKLEYIDDTIVAYVEAHLEEKALAAQEAAEGGSQQSETIVQPKKQESMSTSNEPIKVSPQGNKSGFKALIEADGRIHADDLKGILGVRSIDNIDDEITVEGVALSRRMGYWYKD
jgi:hypothetical protein